MAADGTYSSPIASEGKRFGAMLASLVGGRVFLHNMSRVVLTVSATISIRYALARRQFGEPGKPEERLLAYGAHRRRIMPLLAAAYASQFTRRALTDMYATRTEQTLPELHWRSAGLKAYFTWLAASAVQVRFFVFVLLLWFGFVYNCNKTACA